MSQTKTVFQSGLFQPGMDNFSNSLRQILANKDCYVTRMKLAFTGTATYTTSTIKGSVQPFGSNLNSLPIGNYAKYAYTFFTPDVIAEGDLIIDANNDYYTVLHVTPYWDYNVFCHYVCELTKLTAVILKTLTLGATVDTTTGHFPYTYVESDIYMNFAPRAQATIRFSAGFNVKYDYIGVTSSLMYEGDIIKDDNDVEYKVEHVTPYKTQRSDGFTFQVCAMTKMDYEEHSASSGTWHLDSNSIGTDPRNRIKVLVDTYLAAANIKKDDGVTNALTLTCFDSATYPLTRLFLTKALDAVAVVSCEPSEPKEKHAIHRAPIGYNENVSITLSAVNKSGVTATNLIEQFEQEIRHVFTDNPTLRLKAITNGKSENIDFGYCYLWQKTVTVKYERYNDDLTPSYPTVTFGASQGTTYTIPNITYLDIEPITNNIRLNAMGRVGSHLQKFGAPDYTITIKADLDMEPWSGASADTKISWKRPQTTGTKTDVINEQVFFDIYFNGLSAEVYQNLNLGFGAAIPVTLEKPQVTRTGDTYELTLTFKAYSASAASAYKTWFGINP
jgi:hypothetical protein